MEHFRPKRRLSGAGHSGYWWGAFDWTNLRLAHPTVNRRVTDYLSGKKAGKGCYFPLRDEEQRAECKEDEINEEPILLDPMRAQDCKLLCFDSENGKPVPRYSKNKMNGDMSGLCFPSLITTLMKEHGIMNGRT